MKSGQEHSDRYIFAHKCVGKASSELGLGGLSVLRSGFAEKKTGLIHPSKLFKKVGVQ